MWVLAKVIAFLGYILSSKCIEVYHKMRSFLGLADYYWRFIEDLSSIISPLIALTQNKAKFVLIEACENTFQELKNTYFLSSFDLIGEY